MSSSKKYTWEEAIEALRKMPEHEEMIYNSYLTKDLLGNCKRFYASVEFKELLAIIKKEVMKGDTSKAETLERISYKSLGTNGIKILDLASGNGIAAYSFAKEGFNVYALEPDPSNTVGRGAIDFAKNIENLDNISIIDGYGENIPFEDEKFDIVYVRQALHHANDLKKMLCEIYRVLKKNGMLLATREHVVDNYNRGLKEFLDAQPDHQLYGGENAFTYPDYISAIVKAGFKVKYTYGPYDSVINLFPNTLDNLYKSIINSTQGKIVKFLLGRNFTIKIGMQYLRFKKVQGRLYSFVAIKE